MEGATANGTTTAGVVDVLRGTQHAPAAGAWILPARDRRPRSLLAPVVCVRRGRPPMWQRVAANAG